MSEVVNAKALVWIIVAIDLIALIVFVSIKNISFGFNIDTFSLAGMLVSIAWLFWTVFRYILWKIPFLQGWLVLVPNLNGSWHGKLESTWVDPDTKQSPNPIDTTASIKQSLTKITIDLDTDGMNSTSTVATVKYDPDRRASTISYVYLSEPLAKHRKKNVIHYGAAKLTVLKKDKSITLNGTYWTDNKTSGDIHLERIGD